MKKLRFVDAAVLGACLLALGGAAGAAEDMARKDGMTMQDPKARDDMDMKKGTMGKGDMAKKDAMGKDGTMRKPGMKGDDPAMHNEGSNRQEMKR